MKIAIVGSRNFGNLNLVKNIVKQIKEKYPDAIIISGGCRGVDKTAEIAAIRCGLKTLIFPADWDTYGKKAGFLRNVTIAQSCDILLAFWDNLSKGTAHTINTALDLKKKVYIYDIDNELYSYLFPWRNEI